MNCLLCGSATELFYTKKEKERGQLKYLRCVGESSDAQSCGLIFLRPEQRLKAEEEKGRYDLHNNDPEDEGYLDFLRRATSALVPRLKEGAHGLDFGCGPGPAMQNILEPEGYVVENYDPFYYPNNELLEKQYDFVTSTEVFEHLYDPLTTVKQLSGMLKPGATLVAMTEMVNEPVDANEFAAWWYHTDPTHVCFYSQQTFRWIADQFGWQVEFPRKNVVLLSS